MFRYQQAPTSSRLPIEPPQSETGESDPDLSPDLDQNERKAGRRGHSTLHACALE
jgi:hypothetical protein